MSEIRSLLAEAVADLPSGPDDPAPVARRARRRRRRRVALTVVTALSVAASGIAVGMNVLGGMRRTPFASACTGTWQATEVPNPGNYGASLSAVAALSDSDAWAVGGYSEVDPAYLEFTPPPGSRGPGVIALSTPLVLHWDGEAWERVHAPNREVMEEQGTERRGGVSLSDVSALAPNDVWAVGGSGNSPVIEHWDGVKWSLVDNPTVTDFRDAQLVAVSAASTDDVWAVGQGQSGTVLIEHWDGRTWNVVDAPETDKRSSELVDVAAIDRDDAWAVGRSWDRPLLLHWDGVAWKHTENPFARYSRIGAVEAIASDDVWVVGTTYPDIAGNSPVKPLVGHWDGTRWSEIPVADLLDLSQTALLGVAASAWDDVWVRGWRVGDAEPSRPLILHYDGSDWTEVPEPPGPTLGYGAAIAAAEGRVWLVGASEDVPRAAPFAAYRCKADPTVG